MGAHGANGGPMTSQPPPPYSYATDDAVASFLSRYLRGPLP